jgi:hypothetical protein
MDILSGPALPFLSHSSTAIADSLMYVRVSFGRYALLIFQFLQLKDMTTGITWWKNDNPGSKETKYSLLEIPLPMQLES